MKIFCAIIMEALTFLTMFVQARQASDGLVPEAETAFTVKFEALQPNVATSLAAKARGKLISANDWMVAVANPHTAIAGACVLKEGGALADAIVAVQAVLGLVEPQSSGMGGGGFLVWFDATSRELKTIDGRETAPIAATPWLFQNVNGKRLKFWDAVVGGRSVGVPGTPALMEAAHKRWGQKAGSNLFVDAIQLAESGFAVSPRFAVLVVDDAERLAQFFDTAAYFFGDGNPVVEGSHLTNKKYANVMRRIANQGAKVICSADIAQSSVDTVRGAKNNPGVISLTDLDIYKVKERPAAR